MKQKICFNKSLGVVVGVVFIIVLATFLLSQLTNIRTNTNSRASEPTCTELDGTNCLPTAAPLEICPKSGLDCVTDNALDYDWDTAGYVPCRNINAFGVETKMRCCPKGLVRNVSEGSDPGTCVCPKGTEPGQFKSADDTGKCIEYKSISIKEKDPQTGGEIERCLSGLSCIDGVPDATTPRGARQCFDGEGISKLCCQPKSTVTVPSDSTMQSFCKDNSDNPWFLIW